MLKKKEKHSLNGPNGWFKCLWPRSVRSEKLKGPQGRSSLLSLEPQG